MTTETAAEANDTNLFANNVRINFSDIFAPPGDGYELSHVWGTSYSISLEAYIMVLLAMENQGNVPNISAGQQLSKAQILTVIERNQPKITLLAQQGLIYFNEKFSPEIQALLWKSIRPQVRQEGSFHPKVWLAAFEKIKDEKKEYIFRLLVTSRNLTQDTDFDAAVVFQSTPAAAQQEHKALFDLFKGEISQEWRDRLKKVEFDKNKKRNKIFDADKLPENVHTVISPFLDSTKVHDLIGKGLINIFSTVRAISDLRDEIKKNPNVKFFVLRDMNTVLTDDGNTDGNSSENDSAEPLIPHYNLHAKLYFTDDTLYLGSRNCTWRGWNSNVEFMVKLPARQTANALVNFLVCDPDGEEQQKSSLNRKNALFQPYKPDLAEKIKDSEDEKNKSALIEFLKTVKAEVSFDGNALTLSLKYSTDLPEKLQIRPLFCKESAKEWTNGANKIRWEGFSQKDFSPYFIVVLDKFQMTLIAETAEGTPRNDYAARFKSSFSRREMLEYLCSTSEVPLNNFHFVSCGETSDDNSSSVREKYGESRRYFERLIRNVVADGDLAARYRNDIKSYIDSPNNGIGDKELKELHSFFSRLAEEVERRKSCLN